MPIIKRYKFNKKFLAQNLKKGKGYPLGFFFQIFGPKLFGGSLCFNDWT